ncbi:MAG: hypothetical protein WA098_06925, partial [Smithella sp.]
FDRREKSYCEKSLSFRTICHPRVGLSGIHFSFSGFPIGVGNDEQRLDSGYDHIRMTVGVYTLNDSFDFLMPS